VQLEERNARLFNYGRQFRRLENRTAEGTANGKAGSPDQYG